MSHKGSKKFNSAADPRTRLVKDLNVGDPLRDSTIRYIKPQRKGGANGVRITLADFRSVWARSDWKVASLQFGQKTTTNAKG